MDEEALANVGQEEPSQTSEQMIPQSKVNKLIGSAKAEAQEKARRQAEAEFQQKLADLQAQKQQADAKGEDTRDIDVDAIYQQVHEKFNAEMEQRQLRDHMKSVADAYESKMANGKKDYEDFDEVMQEFNPAEFPQIVYLVSGMDNAADVIYELSKNPQKLTTIDYLAQRSPRKAQAELQRIGKSIAENKAAKAEDQQAQIDAPLDRLQPGSKTGGNGRLSIRDLKNQPWLRG